MAITIDKIISVTGSVVNTGFQQAALIGNILTENILVPADDNRTLSFANAAAVGTYFGTTSDEYMFASTYFNSYTNSLNVPQSILFSRYVSSATAAYIFSGQIASPSATVTAIKALGTPAMSIPVNGTTRVLSMVQADFASATGLSDIATIIQTKLAAQLAGCTAAIIGTNQFECVAPSSGASTSTISYATGNVAVLLGLDSDSNPTLSQGTPGGTATFNMDLIVASNANWIALSYVTRLTGDAIGDSYAKTVALTGWIANQSSNYVGMWWEGGTQALSPSSSTNLARILVGAGYGTRTPDTAAGQVVYNVPIQVMYNGASTTNSVTTHEVGIYAAFEAGIGASINYNVVNGKINFAGKRQSGLATNVSTDANYDALLLQGYNVYGAFASRASSYQFTENGSVGGDLLWVDNLYDAVWLTDQMQNQLATLISNVGRIAYNATGVSTITAVLTNVIQAALTNGVVESGNSFSAAQVLEIQNLVGKNVAPLLTSNGYYIYFPVIAPADRVNRAPLQVYVLYTNGGAINQISIGQVFVA